MKGKYFIKKNGVIIHDIDEGDFCPYCKYGQIVVRRGKYSDFYACTTFPRCGFTQPLKNQEEDGNKFFKKYDNI